jgi:hypothetical protein
MNFNRTRARTHTSICAQAHAHTNAHTLCSLLLRFFFLRLLRRVCRAIRDYSSPTFPGCHSNRATCPLRSVVYTFELANRSRAAANGMGESRGPARLKLPSNDPETPALSVSGQASRAQASPTPQGIQCSQPTTVSVWSGKAVGHAGVEYDPTNGYWIVSSDFGLHIVDAGQQRTLSLLGNFQSFISYLL